MTTGELIRSARKKAGFTQKHLGELCGIAEPTIRRYELGSLNPKIETIKKIAKPLGIPWFELYGDDASQLLSAGIVEGMRMAANRPMVIAEEEVLKPYRDRGYQFTEEEALCVKALNTLNEDGQILTLQVINRLSNDSRYQAAPDWLNSDNKED